MSDFQLSDLFSFEKMVATTVLKYVYFIGLILIVGFGLVSFVGSFGVMKYSGSAGLGTMLMAVVGTALGVLVWRVICELYLLGFRIYDRLGEIRDGVRRTEPVTH